MGIIQVPELGVRAYVQRGELLTVLPDYCPEPMRIYILYANRRHVPLRVRVFMQWLEQVIQPRLQNQPTQASFQ